MKVFKNRTTFNGISPIPFYRSIIHSRNTLYWLIGLFVVGIFCPSNVWSYVCVVRDNGIASCIDDQTFFDPFSKVSPELLEKIKSLLQSRFTDWGTDKEDALYFCNAGGLHSMKLGEPLGRVPGRDRAGEMKPGSKDLAKMVAQCTGDVLTKITAGLPGGRGGGFSTRGWGDLVTRTKEKVNQRVNTCPTTAGQGLMEDGFFRDTGIGYLIEKVYDAFRDRITRAYDDAGQGAKDAFAGKPPQQDMTDFGQISSYGKGYDLAKKTLEAKCNGGNKSSCDTLEKMKTKPEPEPDPAPKPDPTKPDPDPAPKPDPTPTPASTLSGDCIDDKCQSACERAGAWWKLFSEQCDKSNWSTYDCVSFIARNNACPDPAIINPGPDGDYRCHRPVSKDYVDENIARIACEKRGQLYSLDDKKTPTCKSFEGVSDELVEQMWREHLCYRISPDNEMCSKNQGGIPRGGGKTPPPAVAIIRTGDTLTGLALKHYGEAARWIDIRVMNKKVLDNPNVLRVGQSLVINPFSLPGAKADKN